MHSVPLRAQVASRLPECEMRFGSRQPSKSKGLGLLFAALGGTTAVARLFGRDISTAAKWRTGALAIPAEIAKALREEAMRVASSLQDEAFRLKFDEIPKDEHRAAHGLARRRQASFAASENGHMAIRRARSGCGRGSTANFMRAARAGDSAIGCVRVPMGWLRRRFLYPPVPSRRRGRARARGG